MCSKGFTHNDLINMMSVLEVCTKRGAFLAEELSGVGQLYDKLKMCKQSLNQKTTQIPSCPPRQTRIDEEEEVKEGNGEEGNGEEGNGEEGNGEEVKEGEVEEVSNPETTIEISDLIAKNSIQV